MSDQRDEKPQQDEKTSEQSADWTGNNFPVICIGASAGGLEALESFFAAVPVESSLAFVVITHTDPEHTSMLPELLAKKSKAPVQIIENGTPIEINRVYIPPSNRDPLIEGQAFKLKKRPGRPSVHMPIDLFCKSLSSQHNERAVCIILSGTGTDGTQGVRLIKEKGGLVMAQDPKTAKHSGMPTSAMETGLVDLVLSPSDMPGRLIEYFNKPAVLKADEKQQADPLKSILTFLANRTRHDFSQYKSSTVVRRIERRMTVTRSRDTSEYLRFLYGNPGEAYALFQDLLIGVTSFFRDPEAFAFLKNIVLPDVTAGKPDGSTLRVWVAGCSTGEEAYSVAMLIKEHLEEMGLRLEMQIFATDIDGRAIEKARSGIYPQNIATDVSPQRLKRFFVQAGDAYQINHEIREAVVFAEHNVLRDPPFSHLDLLVCRNLLIYLQPQAQNRLLPLFHYSLNEGGVLFLGTSESVGRHPELFQPLGKAHSIYRKMESGTLPHLDFPTGTKYLKPDSQETGIVQGPDHRQIDPRSAARALDKVLLQEHTPACAVINAAGDVVLYHGRTGKYLEPPPGRPTSRIGELAREGLRFPLLAALRRAADPKNLPIRERGLRVRTNGGHMHIDLTVKAVNEPTLANCLMVVFEDQPQSPEPQVQSGQQEKDFSDQRRVQELEEELLRVNQDYRGAMEELQSANEELRSTNEEMHSSNEELQSTNEELQSSKEELQSVNEELSTVNAELHSKITELNEAYSSISYVLNSTRIAMVFLNNDLLIERFTEEAARLINLIHSDVGRPLDHISNNLGYRDLAENCRKVLQTLERFEDEVVTADGHWYRMQISVHSMPGHTIRGVVLTFVNIDGEKAAQEREKKSAQEAEAAQAFAENIIDTVRESLLVIGTDQRVITANRSFYDTFKTYSDQTQGVALSELGNGQWKIPALQTMLDKIIHGGQSFEGYLVEHQFPEIGPKSMLLNARLLRGQYAKESKILLAIEDVTEK